VYLNWGPAQTPIQPTPTPVAVLDDAGFEEYIELPAYLRSSNELALVRQIDLQTIIPSRSRVEVLRYTVQSGDAVFGIAAKFNIEPETVLWGNMEVLNDDPHLLRPGQELNILPVDGTYYQWEENDTIEGVADEFGTEAQAILDWPGNGIDPVDPKIEEGQWLVVPGGRRAFRRWFIPVPARPQSGVGSAYGPGGCTGDYTGGAIGTGGFIWPTANHYISGNDYWSGHLAIDIAAGTGAGIWAADSGVVVFAGWSTVGYGYMVMLDHGNGWVTLYAHLSRVQVGCGASVAQGQGIGSAGSTGNSTGPHLHFETRLNGGFVNPWFVLP
jgi:murein DD-endopeptidase MepM/ murein hydrolase activator NlpD